MTADYEFLLVDTPADGVRRITLNRPEKRNAISTPLRTELLDALRAHDNDPGVRVSIVRGAGPCFSAGYDLGSPLMADPPFYSAPGDGQWARQAGETWFSLWDLAKPVIAQIHGYAIAGATELASACDLVYVAEDARISYPVVRVASPPDWQYHTVLLGLRRAMELMLTGDAVDGIEAARIGFANRAYPADRLAEEVLAIAVRVAGIPSELTQINKRSVHRAFDVWGARAAIRAGTELTALAAHTEAATRFRRDALAAVKAAVTDSSSGSAQTAGPAGPDGSVGSGKTGKTSEAD
ncbi:MULTISPECIES: enoyl-CoA hydratase-related protein [unclassified Pseudofrankia]|uniref:enoyl-CoA hydratase-related protein n=1 Tax=unclassified Pseudofrankia TaxID=2994372 RepID=UPI0009F61528|nr:MULTISPECIES: enoyl-CoA hydratase-related protein [unclassified Pseudofrankia]MDT3441525.1 enoyl-CoA hydratase-related protein [Pseudofrankia sp. BMG5.37]